MLLIARLSSHSTGAEHCAIGSVHIQYRTRQHVLTTTPGHNPKFTSLAKKNENPGGKTMRSLQSVPSGARASTIRTNAPESKLCAEDDHHPVVRRVSTKTGLLHRDGVFLHMRSHQLSQALPEHGTSKRPRMSPLRPPACKLNASRS